MRAEEESEKESKDAGLEKATSLPDTHASKEKIAMQYTK
jgi:hypothetical protein